MLYCVVMDGESGIRDQDKHVAGYAHEAGKGVILSCIISGIWLKRTVIPNCRIEKKCAMSLFI